MSKTLGWIEVLVGTWLIVAPFVLEYYSTTGARWNDIIMGLIVGIIGLVVVFGNKGEAEKVSGRPGGETVSG